MSRRDSSLASQLQFRLAMKQLHLTRNQLVFNRENRPHVKNLGRIAAPLWWLSLFLQPQASVAGPELIWSNPSPIVRAADPTAASARPLLLVSDDSHLLFVPTLTQASSRHLNRALFVAEQLSAGVLGNEQQQEANQVTSREVLVATQVLRLARGYRTAEPAAEIFTAVVAQFDVSYGELVERIQTLKNWRLRLELRTPIYKLDPSAYSNKEWERMLDADWREFRAETKESFGGLLKNLHYDDVLAHMKDKYENLQLFLQWPLNFMELKKDFITDDVLPEDALLLTGLLSKKNKILNEGTYYIQEPANNNFGTVTKAKLLQANEREILQAEAQKGEAAILSLFDTPALSSKAADMFRVLVDYAGEYVSKNNPTLHDETQRLFIGYYAEKRFLGEIGRRAAQYFVGAHGDLATYLTDSEALRLDDANHNFVYFLAGLLEGYRELEPNRRNSEYLKLISDFYLNELRAYLVEEGQTTLSVGETVGPLDWAANEKLLSLLLTHWGSAKGGDLLADILKDQLSAKIKFSSEESRYPIQLLIAELRSVLDAKSQGGFELGLDVLGAAISGTLFETKNFDKVIDAILARLGELYTADFASTLVNWWGDRLLIQPRYVKKTNIQNIQRVHNWISAKITGEKLQRLHKENGVKYLKNVVTLIAKDEEATFSPPRIVYNSGGVAALEGLRQNMSSQEFYLFVDSLATTVRLTPPGFTSKERKAEPVWLVSQLALYMKSMAGRELSLNDPCVGSLLTLPANQRLQSGDGNP